MPILYIHGCMQLIPGNSIAKLRFRLFCSPQQQFIMRTHPRLSSSWALRPLLPLAVVSALTLAACGAHNAAPQKPAGGAAPEVPVGVVTATPAEVGLLTELPGRRNSCPQCGHFAKALVH